MREASFNRLTPVSRWAGVSFWAACHSRPRAPAGSPPSTVRARSVSWVPMWFISRFRHWGG